MANAAPLIIGLGLRAILSLGYIAALIRVRLGSRFGLVTLLICLLLVNCLSTMAIDYLSTDFFKSFSKTMAWILSCLLGIKYLTFDMSHWILAFQYN